MLTETARTLPVLPHLSPTDLKLRNEDWVIFKEPILTMVHITLFTLRNRLTRLHLLKAAQGNPVSGAPSVPSDLVRYVGPGGAILGDENAYMQTTLSQCARL